MGRYGYGPETSLGTPLEEDAAYQFRLPADSFTDLCHRDERHTLWVHSSMVEQEAFNLGVDGSSPSGPTKELSS